MTDQNTTDPDDKQHLAVIRDFIERTTHWREGGADRHDALEVALPALADSIEWTEKGLAEWREVALNAQREARMVDAKARIAIGHLKKMLLGTRTAHESFAADTAARDWLASIGQEPD